MTACAARSRGATGDKPVNRQLVAVMGLVLSVVLITSWSACNVKAPSSSATPGNGGENGANGGSGGRGLNQLPTADAGADQNKDVGATVTLSALGSTDPDGDQLSFSWQQTMGPTVSINDLGLATIEFVVAADGVYEFTVTVTDGRGGADKDTVHVYVGSARPAGAPLADAGPPQTVFEGDVVALPGGNSADPEGGALIYSWRQLSGPDAELSDASVAEPIFVAPQVDDDTELVFELTVTDDQSLTDADVVTITVRDRGGNDNENVNDNVTLPSDDLESANPGVDFGDLTAGQAVVLTAPIPSGFTAAQTCSCEWMVNDGGTFDPADSCTTTYVPAADDTRITVTRTCDGQITKLLQDVTVSPATGLAVMITGCPEASGAEEGTPLSLTADVSNSAGDTQEFAWTVTAGDSTLDLDDQPTVEVTPGGGTSTIQVEVTDLTGADVLGVATATCTLSATAAPVPFGCTAERTTTSVPPPGFVEETIDFTLDLSPSRSDLAKALGLVFLVDPSIFPPQTTTLQVGPNGDIVDSKDRFAVAFGCLTRTDEGEVPVDPAEEIVIGPGSQDPGPCQSGQIALGTQGLQDIGEEFICVAVESSSCADCSQTATPAWQVETFSTNTYRALGSITAEVFNPRTFRTETVHVQEGDEVTLDIRVETQYEIVNGS
jgi:hypothetical protein